MTATDGYIDDDWDGKERRTIPFQLINYVDEKLTAHAKAVTDALNSHTGEEMERYQDIIDKQDQLENKIGHLESLIEVNGKKITSLTESITSFMSRQESACGMCKDKVIEQCEIIIDEAIPSPPHDPEATPREKRKGHRKAHASLIDQVQREMESWARLREKIREWAVIGALGVVAVSVLQYLLRVPH